MTIHIPHNKYAEGAFLILMSAFLMFMLCATILVYLTFFPILDNTSCKAEAGIIADKQTDYNLGKICKKLKKKNIKLEECIAR